MFTKVSGLLWQRRELMELAEVCLKASKVRKVQRAVRAGVYGRAGFLLTSNKSTSFGTSMGPREGGGVLHLVLQPRGWGVVDGNSIFG